MKKLNSIAAIIICTLFLQNSIAQTGNVGIGTSTPGFPLTFASPLGDRISLFGNSGNHYGFGIQNNLLQIHASAVGDDIAFGYGSSNNFTETMRIRGNGNVGIGTTSPVAKLHVSAGDASLVLFGPNTYGGRLYVGAALNQGVALTAQVLASDGNLHLDPAAAHNIYIGYYQARDVFINPNGGNVGIGTTSPAASLEVNGYTKLGSDAPSIKFKKLTGTTAATEGGIVDIPYGLNGDKILSVSVLVKDVGYTPPGYTLAIGEQFNYFVSTSYVRVINVAGNSAKILSKTIVILITYEE